MLNTVMPFGQVNDTHRDRLGSKGYTLALLHRAGFPVPDGFVVTADAYLAFLTATGLDATVANIATDGDPAVIATDVRAAFERTQIPTSTARAIRDAYTALGGGAVAVRSSALAEDSGTASYAGQHDTFLGVADDSLLLKRVKQCWASLWSERALAYRRRPGCHDETPAMAVIVQQMVPASRSGVAFTRDPVSRDCEVTVVEAISGRGDALVGGHMTGDRYVVAKGDPHPNAGKGVLDDKQLASVVRLARHAEDWAGQPQDVEWALDSGGSIHLLQARPITSTGAAGPGVITRWTRDNVGEVIPDTVTPLSWSILDPLSNDSAIAVMRRLGMSVPSSSTLFGRFYGRVYLNQTLFQAVMNRFYPSKTGWPAYPRLALTMLKALWLVCRLPGESKSITNSILERRHSAQHLDLNVLAEANLIEQLTAWRDLGGKAMQIHIGITVIAEVLSQALDRCLADRRHPSADARSVTTGLTGIRSAEAGEALGALARWVSRNDALKNMVLQTEPEELERKLKTQVAGKALWAKVEAFLAEHGHLAFQEFELCVPRWRDDPRIVLGALQAQLRAASTGPVEEPTAARLTALAQIEREMRPLKRWGFRLFLRWATAFTVRRENLKYHLVMAHSRLRDLYLALAARFVADGRLVSTEDVFFLMSDEVKALVDEPGICDRQKLVTERRQAWRAGQKTTPPLALDRWPDGRIRPASPPSVTGDTAGQLLLGLAASPGSYTGRARVALSLENAGKLEPGEVLVIQAATPGWSPLLWAAGALVTEIGGTLSHSAIIAREYGLPAVLSVTGATHLVHTGQLVQVDGSRGTVRLLEEDK